MKRIIIVILSLVVIVSAWFWITTRPAYLFYGEVEAKQYTLSSRAIGRIARLAVDRGDRVTAGDLIYELSSPEIDAKAAQASAALRAAEANASNVAAGSRAQEIAIAQANLAEAKVANNLEKQTYLRINNLYQQGVVSLQRRDETKAAFDSSALAVTAAEQALALAKEGARVDTLEAANANADLAKAATDEAAVFTDETKVYTPHSGEIAQILFEQGELVPAALPVVHIVDSKDAWGVFNVREDQMPLVRKGAVFLVDVPALALKDVRFTVRHISALGHFATWRTSRPGEGYDMRTFSVEATPDQPIEDLRAGMTLLVSDIVRN